MMGRQKNPQGKLFSYHVSLHERVRKDHVLRKIAEKVDFDFVYDEVEESYGDRGNVSVPPPVILKMMLLLMLYDVRSERELMETIPERLDWLWFLGYGLDDTIPDHSILSKARTRWGVDVFRKFFERIVYQCVEASLVDGEKIFVDASLIQADASKNSVVNTQSLQRYLNTSYQRLLERLDDQEVEGDTPVNGSHISTTDPDASLVRHGPGKAGLCYKTHRAVDPRHEVITATVVTPGSVDDGEMLPEVLQVHEETTSSNVSTVVADSKYGTIENYLMCHDKDIEGHIPSLEGTQEGTGSKEGIFSRDMFTYDAEADTYRCPAGEVLRRRNYNARRSSYEYKASRGVCAGCSLREGCTRSRNGRSIKRHERQEVIDRMKEQARTRGARKDIKKRQDLSERSFARSTRFGYKRSRWRRLWRLSIQDYLIAAIQNIMILISKVKGNSMENKAQKPILRQRLLDLIQKIIPKYFDDNFSKLIHVSS
jgi:transposase